MKKGVKLVDGKQIHIRMENVLFVPELTLNLMSLRRLESAGTKFIFHEGSVVFEDEDQDAVGVQ